MQLAGLLRPFAATADLLAVRLSDVWTWMQAFEPMPMNLFSLWADWVVRNMLGIPD